MKKSILFFSLLILTLSAVAQDTLTTKNSDLWSASRPDGHAPISVMGDHVHHKGEWMASYRFMFMNMEDMLDGSSDISTANVHTKGYMVSPLQMQMKMHMVGVMHAVTDKITLMAMFNYIENDMDLHMLMMGMGSEFSTTSSGLGDTKVSMLYQFFNKNKMELHGMLGVILPTGGINEKDVTPMSAPDKVILPYPMQLGSGSIGTQIGITLLGQGNTVSYGGQANGTFYVNDNRNNYRLGNTYNGTAWLGVKTTPWLSFSVRAAASVTEKIKGTNTALNPMMVTTANTANSGGFTVQTGLGMNTYIPSGSLKNLRLGIEFLYPAYQNVNNLQLSTKETLVIGLQYSFGGH